MNTECLLSRPLRTDADVRMGVSVYLLLLPFLLLDIATCFEVPIFNDIRISVYNIIAENDQMRLE